MRRNKCLVALKSLLIALILLHSTLHQASAQQSQQQDIPKLIQALKDPDSNIRDVVALFLGKMGASAAPAAHALVQALKDPDSDVRFAAAVALGEIGASAVPAAPALVQALKDSNGRVRDAAAFALGQLGASAASVVPDVAKLLKNPDTNVRLAAANALGKMGAFAAPAAPALVQALKDPDTSVRFAVAAAIGQLGASAASVVPDVEKLLKNPASDVRLAATVALWKMGASAAPAAPALVQAIKDPDTNVRFAVADAFGQLGASAAYVVPDVEKLLKDPDTNVRLVATVVLGQLGASAASAVPDIKKLLKDPDTSVRAVATAALGKIGASAASAVPDVDKLLKDPDTNVRTTAAAAIGQLGASAVSAIPDIEKLLKDPDTNVRVAATAALGEMGTSAASAVPALVQALKDSNSVVRSRAVDALGHIGASVQDQVSTMKWSTTAYFRLDTTLRLLKPAYESVMDVRKNLSTPDHTVDDAAANLRRAIQLIEAKQRADVVGQALEWASHNKFLLGIIVYLIVVGSVCGLLLAFSPLTLLRVNEGIKVVDKLKLPDKLSWLEAGPRYILGIGFLNYHPRVLDAWVGKYADTARKNLRQRPTSEDYNVEDHDIYVDIPVVFPDATDKPVASKFQPSFAEKTAVVLLWGEGGSGKTTLARKMALWALADTEADRLCKTHRMLPVFIDENLPQQGNNASLLAHIKGRLRLLINEEIAPSDDLVKNLLQKKRVILIVDGYSELDTNTRQAIRPDDPVLALNAMLVTSRAEERLSDVKKLSVRTGLLKGSGISVFLEDYLQQCGKRQLFPDKRLFADTTDFAALTDGREITPLLARLFAEHMIDYAEKTVSDRPQNVPELMDAYVEEMCRNGGRTKDEKPIDLYPVQTYLPLAHKIAWWYLKDTLVPGETPTYTLVPALTEAKDGIDLPKGKETWNAVVEGMIDPLRLMQWRGVGSPNVKFTLDPLAEYLAARYLVKHGRLKYDVGWKTFLDEAEAKNGSQQSIKGFLIALHDVVDAKSEKDTPRQFILDELRRRFPGITFPPTAPVHAVVGTAPPSSAQPSDPAGNGASTSPITQTP